MFVESFVYWDLLSHFWDILEIESLVAATTELTQSVVRFGVVVLPEEPRLLFPPIREREPI